MSHQIKEAVDYILDRGAHAPEVGIILGTGLGSLIVDKITNPIVIPFEDIPNFPTSTVEFHKGKLIYGDIAGKKILAMQGRLHYYEGYSMQQITFPVRVMRSAGINTLLISNAAGNLNLDSKKGELMLLDDHINLQPDNPLRGPNDNDFGPRFPDMSQPYSKSLNEKLVGIAKSKEIKLQVGVYACVTGPNLETRAEYRYLRRIGADAVGMSTVPEVIVANHAGLPCCAISVLTDDCDPDNLQPANIDEIISVAAKAENKLAELYVELIRML
jgi:purine-nucleoside phosphorylase